MKTAIVYVGAAIAEIAGCFAFWGWLRLGKPIWWLLPGVCSLIVFAYLLTLVETEAAGRAYATYGGIYIVASLVWLWIVEGARPDRWDITGASLCLIGAADRFLRFRSLPRTFDRCRRWGHPRAWGSPARPRSSPAGVREIDRGGRSSDKRE